MKKLLYWTLLVFVSVAFSSCDMFKKGNDPQFQLSALQGLWLQNGDTIVGQYVRFTTEGVEDEAPYFYGREWTESDDVFESDLLEDWEKNGVHGNGWFKYKFETNGTLTELHLMSDQGAEIPKVYIVTKLTETEMTYYEKEFKTNTSTFVKVVETK